MDAWAPSLAADPVTGTLHLVFVDTRGEQPNRRIFVTQSRDGGSTWAPARRLDPREPDADQPDRTLGNEWAPRIAAHAGRLIVAYTHRERPDPDEQPSWNAYVIESDDGGASWGAPRRLDGGGFPERLAADTTLAIDGAGSWRAAFSTYRGTAPDAELLIASPSAADVAAVASDQWWPSLVALGDGAFAVTWQDFRAGGNDIYVARLTGTGLGPALRVDDAGASNAQAWRPRAALAPDGTLYVIWEDSRSGHAELRAAAGVLP
jgi:hypothetical protein